MDEAFPKKKVEGDNSIDRVSSSTFAQLLKYEFANAMVQLGSKVFIPPQ